MSLLSMITSGGFAMYPLLLCSVIGLAVILERVWNYRSLAHSLRSFHLEALNILLTGDVGALRALCHRHSELPTASLLGFALERRESKDARLRSSWVEAMERRRQLLNQELRRNLWILGTIGSATPFIGLFGTVVGILRSFHDMARTGSGGFAVVASGISEALIATAVGIVVAVIAVIAYNAFQTRWSSLILLIRVHTEEFAELLGGSPYVGGVPGLPAGAGDSAKGNVITGIGGGT